MKLKVNVGWILNQKVLRDEISLSISPDTLTILPSHIHQYNNKSNTSNTLNNNED